MGRERLSIFTSNVFKSFFIKKAFKIILTLGLLNFSLPLLTSLRKRWKQKAYYIVSLKITPEMFWKSENKEKLWNQSDFKLPSLIYEKSGFHISCCGRFNALSQSTRTKIKRKSPKKKFVSCVRRPEIKSPSPSTTSSALEQLCLFCC